MADFIVAYKDTIRNEGGYTNNSKDSGKETYKGISIVHNPHWKGWDIVHSELKKMGLSNTVDIHSTVLNTINKNLEQIEELQSLVKSLYKTKYWDKLNLDNETSQEVANKVFDIAVKMGVKTAENFYKEAMKNV